MAIPKMSGLSPLAAIRNFSEPASWAALEQLLGQGAGDAETRAGWSADDWARHDFQVMLMLEAARKHLTLEAARRRWTESLTALNHWAQLRLAFKKRLQSGEIIATGYAKPVELAFGRTAIPADKWRFLELDFRNGAASGEGLEIVSILIDRADHVDEALTKPTIAAQTACRQWIERKAETGEKPANRKSLYDEARAEIGPALSQRAFRRAWDEAAPDDWKRPGRKSTRRIDSRGKS